MAGEIFHSWVIESPRPLERELPLREAGLNVTLTDDVTPYRERKVRILNGAHTMTALAAFLSGKDTVRECMQDPLFFELLDRGIHEEILPTLELPRQELTEFAASGRSSASIIRSFEHEPHEHRAEFGQQVQGAHSADGDGLTSARAAAAAAAHVRTRGVDRLLSREHSR